MLRLIHSAEYQAVSWGERALLQVGDHAVARLDKLVGLDAEHVLQAIDQPQAPCTSGRQDLYEERDELIERGSPTGLETHLGVCGRISRRGMAGGGPIERSAVRRDELDDRREQKSFG